MTWEQLWLIFRQQPLLLCLPETRVQEGWLSLLMFKWLHVGKSQCGGGGGGGLCVLS